MENIVRNDKRRKLERPITGVIQKDRIWEQWYSKEAMEQELPKMNQKDYMFKCNENDPKHIMINNRGLKKFTTPEFEEEINSFIKAFDSYGFDVGTTICTIGLTTPELIAVKYASTSLGLITCNFNFADAEPTDDKRNVMYERLKSIKPRMVFVLDILEPDVSSVLNMPEFKDIIKVRMPLERSTKGLTKEKMLVNLLNLKTKISNKNVKNNTISLNEFLSLGYNRELPVSSIYEEKLPCNISFTSGTTGVNKAVLLSHDAFNALAFQQKIGNFGFERGEKHLALIPPFLAFWDADVVHAVMCMGAENILELKLSYENVPKYMTKYLPQLGIWPQSMWDSMLHLPPEELEKVNENLREAIVGGERCEINQAEQFYNKTGIVQMTGYGATEVSTTFSIAHQYCNKIGTAGIPLPFNNVKIVKDDGTDATYGEPGRLFITGPCLMNGYYNRDDYTREVLKNDVDGITWYDTKDYAIMDNDGCLTVLDRAKDPVNITNHGVTKKVQLLDVAEIIKKNKNVKICKVCSYEGKMVLHLTINDFTDLTIEQAVQDVISSMKENLEEFYLPDYIYVTKQLPRTAVGKVNYRELDLLTKDIVEFNRDGEKLKVIYNLENEKIKSKKRK